LVPVYHAGVHNIPAGSGRPRGLFEEDALGIFLYTDHKLGLTRMIHSPSGPGVEGIGDEFF
jgi:hypothetical protein